MKHSFITPKIAAQRPQGFRSQAQLGNPAELSAEGVRSAIREACSRQGIPENAIAMILHDAHSPEVGLMDLSEEQLGSAMRSSMRSPEVKPMKPARRVTREVKPIGFIKLADNTAIPCFDFEPVRKDMRKIKVYDNGISPEDVWAVLPKPVVTALKAPKANFAAFGDQRPSMYVALRGTTNHFPFDSNGLLVPIMFDETTGEPYSDIRWFHWEKESDRLFNKKEEM